MPTITRRAPTSSSRTGRARRIARSGTRCSTSATGGTSCSSLSCRASRRRERCTRLRRRRRLRDRHLAEQRFAVPGARPARGTSYFGSLSAKVPLEHPQPDVATAASIGEPALEVGRRAAGRRRGAGDDALRLEASGWKLREGTAICSRPGVQRFYTLFAERAAARGWLRLLFLTVGGQPDRDLVLAGLSTAAVSVQDGIRPGVRHLLAVQAADVASRPSRRINKGSRKSISSATRSRGSSNGRRRRARTTGCSCSRTPAAPACASDQVSAWCRR